MRGLPETPIIEALRRIVSLELGGELTSAEALTGGFKGHVFRIQVQRSDSVETLCAKLVQWSPEPTYQDEPANDRVYGSRLSNLLPSRRLLDAHGLPLPRLHAHGVLEGAPSIHYHVMDYLDGRALAEGLADDAESSDRSSLIALAGRVLGRIHSITRGHPGWVDLPQDEAWDWTASFFESLRSRLEAACSRSSRLETMAGALADYCEGARAAWQPPESFSLSHSDGLQAVVRKSTGSDWDVVGLIDIEDHLFTDPRFALSGLFMALPFRAAFREAYESSSPWPDGFEEVRGTYQLYLLATWLTVMVGLAPESARARSEIGPIEELIAATLTTSIRRGGDDVR